MASRMRPMSKLPPIVFLTPISTLSKSMNTAIRVLRVSGVRLFMRLPPGETPGSLSGRLDSEVVGLQNPGGGIEPIDYSVKSRLRVRIERLRAFDVGGDDTR